MKKVIFVHGEKGGSGKSVVSSIIVDFYINKKSKLLLIEGDNSTPDVARRFANDPRVDCVQTTLGGDDSVSAISNIINFVDNNDCERVVINLPSRASDTIDPLAVDLIKPSFEALEFEIVVLFVVAEKIDSPLQAAASLQNGLASIADQRIAILNEKSRSISIENYAWATNPESGREKWLESGGQEAHLSHLHERVLSITEDAAYSDYLNSINIAERILLKRWLKSGFEIGDLIEQESDVAVDAKVA